MGLTSDAWFVCGSDYARVNILPFVQGFLVFRTAGVLRIYRTVRRPSCTLHFPIHACICLPQFDCTSGNRVVPRFRRLEDPGAGAGGISTELTRVNITTLQQPAGMIALRLRAGTVWIRSDPELNPTIDARLVCCLNLAQSRQPSDTRCAQNLCPTYSSHGAARGRGAARSDRDEW